MDALDFIDDADLRETLENSLEFIYALRLNLAAEKRSALYREETCRVVILYVVSVIEAVLLHLYKSRHEKLWKTEYRYVHQLPPAYVHVQGSAMRLVVAVQENIERRDHEIGLRDLVMLFRGKVLLRQTAEKVLELNEIRNTLHFSKARNKECSLARVENALLLLVYVLERAPNAITKNKL